VGDDASVAAAGTSNVADAAGSAGCCDVSGGVAETQPPANAMSRIMMTVLWKGSRNTVSFCFLDITLSPSDARHRRHPVKYCPSISPWLSSVSAVTRPAARSSGAAICHVTSAA